MASAAAAVFTFTAPICSALRVQGAGRAVGRSMDRRFGFLKHRLKAARCCCAGEQQQENIAAADGDDETGGLFRPAKKFITAMSSQNEDFKMQLRRYGIAGVLSYGLFNTAYYLGTFLFVWLFVAPSPGKLGYAAAAQRFMKVLAMVWAGSQVTKLFRAAAALAIAPLVDNSLSWFTRRFGFRSREKAFAFLVASCFGLALAVFLLVTSLWA